MKSYKKGYKWEQRVKEAYARGGWIIFRCAGSKPIDLICFKRGKKPIFVECKAGDRFNPARLIFLDQLAEMCGARIVWALKPKGKGERLRKRGREGCNRWNSLRSLLRRRRGL